MISVPNLCGNRLEDLTNFSITILLSIAVQVYEFHEKSKKVEKEKTLNDHKQKCNKKGCVEKFTEIRDVIFMRTTLVHSQPS